VSRHSVEVVAEIAESIINQQLDRVAAARGAIVAVCRCHALLSTSSLWRKGRVGTLADPQTPARERERERRGAALPQGRARKARVPPKSMQHRGIGAHQMPSAAATAASDAISGDACVRTGGDAGRLGRLPPPLLLRPRR
jgi:hypothetical protein